MAKSNPTRERAATKAERRSRSLANLEKNKIKKGEVRNPRGLNGRQRSEHVAAFLDQPEDTERGRALIRRLGLPDDTPRIDVILHREFRDALGKGGLARKGLREQYAGKPRQQVDMSSDDGSMSPLGRDSVAEALRVAIAEKRKAAEKEAATAPKEPPADVLAGTQ